MSRNVSGQAYALTVVTPILDGHVQELTEHLEALPEGPGSPLARVPGTHLARWAVIDQVKHQGGGQRHRDALSDSRLLFTSNFDGELDTYLEALRTGLGEDADAVWGHCRGCQTLEQVHSNLDKRTRLIEFALGAQGLAAADLKARFEEAFPA